MADPTPRAVFLSYASQDAEAAQRICESLGAAGIEVWFDQRELAGGDVWDAKIRGQISTCALFVPLISANTQARLEGYFRLEWKLAAQRTHTMAEEKTFLVPVVIDATRDADAKVPAEFKAVQWTRLRGGDATATFVAHIHQLLGGDVGARVALPVAPAGMGSNAHATAHRRPGGRLLWLVGAATGIVLLATLGWRFLPGEAASMSVAENPAARIRSDKSIAVLPFTNMSEEKESGLFADGVQEDILTNLALVRELRVVSRTSVAQYRDMRKSMRDIGRELGVTYLLQGSVRKAAGSVRVTAQLIRAANDEHIWAKSYDRELKDVFALQSALATEIAQALQVAVSLPEQKLIARRPTESLAAYELYLKARRIRDRSTNTRAMG